MTRPPDYPAVDPRRVAKLRTALLRDIAAMAPAWQGTHEETGADRAVVEAAVRLAEEATKRLDKTPERDALAFLEMFDVAPPEPVAAKGFAVFALKEDQASPVLAGGRTGVEIEALSGEKTAFETDEDLRVQPGRIGRLATVDPKADLIELAPDAVTTLEPDLAPRPTYSLATFAGVGARVIALSPPVGIKAGDLLRLGEADPVYAEVVSFSDDGMTGLKAPLEGEGLAADTVVERMSRLDAFAMPDLQEHGLYIGDADLLNVEEPATLTLHFEPADPSVSVAALLRAEDVRFEIWGTREEPVEDDGPGWHPLLPLAAAGDDFLLYKAWTGPVDEVEIGDRKARWLRVLPAAKITPGDDNDHPLTVAEAKIEQVMLGIETETPGDGKDDTVSQVAYNGLPLSRASSFLPFGPEPQRFDNFALAAPEAFTKPGATATLDFELLDATMQMVIHAQRFDAERHLYGIGRNGRLQVLDLGGPEILWREFAGPAGEEGLETSQRLDPAFGVHAFGTMIANSSLANDLVVMRTKNGGFYTAEIHHQLSVEGKSVASVDHKGWQQLPDLPEGALEEDEVPALIAAPCRLSLIEPDYVGLLYVATRSGLHFMQLGSDGRSAVDGWRPANMVGVLPKIPISPRLAHVADPDQANATDVNGFNPVSCLTLDASNNPWVFFALQKDVVWIRLEDKGGTPFKVVPGAQPAGLLYREGGERRLAVAAVTTGGMAYWKLDASNYKASFIAERSNAVNVGAGTRLAILPGLAPADTDLPHVLAFDLGDDGVKVVEWAPDGLQPGATVADGEMPKGLISEHRVAEDLLPTDQAAVVAAAIFPPAPGASRALIALGGADQSILRLSINPSYRPDLFDWIEVPEVPGEEDFSDIRVIHSASDGPKLTLDAKIVGKDRNGIPLARIGQGNIDWCEPVEAYRSSDRTAVTLEAESILRGSAGSASAALEGKMILVVPLTPLNPKTNPFRIFKVAKVQDDQEGCDIKVVEPPVLSELMAIGGDAGWYELRASTALSGGTDFKRRLSLIGMPGDLGIPDVVGLFEHADIVATLEALTGTDSDGRKFHFLSDGWPGSIEATHQIKAAFIGGGVETFAIDTLPANDTNPELSWEYFNGDGWKRLDEMFEDSTADFAKGGEITFTVPNDLKPSEIGGQEDYWVRARLVGGDYGRPKYIIKQSAEGADIEQEVTVSTDHMRPPEVDKVTARFNLPLTLPKLVVARNNLQDLDQSSANGLTKAAYAMFQGAFAPPLAGRLGDLNDDDPHARAILVGLTKPLEPGPASLFVAARDQQREASLEIATLGADSRWSSAPLTEEDPTRGFSRSGLLSFAVTARPARIQLLGAALHWLRIWAVGDNAASWAPWIEGMWLNGVPVVQAETVRQEPLGSADGEPGFEVQLLKTPVLPDTLELRVRERLGDEEVAALRETGGEDAVLEKVPNLSGEWVRWTRVESLVDQPGDARVFLADASGTVRFGDGRNGRLVLAGRDNLRAFSYRSGGQRVETKAFASAGPRGSIEALETVLAPLPIAGGRDMPKTAELVARMPDVIRHAGQGLSLGDIEVLARDNDSEIVQVRAFPPTGGRHSVLIAVLTRGESRVPIYSLARRDALRLALSERVSDAWGLACLDVVSVGFVEVEVQVQLIALPGERAALESEAKTALDRFLHAANGGPDGAGWPPGRALWPTDIQRALADLPALDRVDKVTITMPDGREPGMVAADEVITTAETRDIKVIVERGAEA